jgi:hypothetical protein
MIEGGQSFTKIGHVEGAGHHVEIADADQDEGRGNGPRIR